MKSVRASLGVRLLVVCELLFIAGWICLLFEWQPGVIAAVPLAVATPVNEYRALRRDIDEQLLQARVTDENDGVLGMAFWPDSDLGQVFVKPVVSETAPAIDALPLTDLISRNEHGLTNTALPKPAVAVTAATVRIGEPARPAAVRREEGGRAAPDCPYRVSSIIRGASRSTAVLVDRYTGASAFVFVGDRLGEWRVAAIADSAVVLQAAETRRTLLVE